MQVTLDAAALKPFTKALICIARYGDELTLHSTPQTFALSATNSSKSAYARLKYDRTFFQKYAVDVHGEDDEVTGQLLVKSLLSILRHRAVDKTVEKCEMSIMEHCGRDETQEDGLESRLVVVLHCKHGVIKTHRLLLSTPTALMAPGVPDTSTESFLTVGPRAIRDMVEHFPLSKGNNKSDSQLIWHFGESDVEVKTLESSIDSKGKSQLATELTISAEEFDVYNLFAAPTVIAFHLGEFNATIAFTDAIGVTMDLRFTDPAAPLFIDVESDGLQALFVISTSQVQNSNNLPPQVILNNRKKRMREDEEGSQGPASPTPRPKKPMKAAQATFQGSRGMSSTPSQTGSMPPPDSFPASMPPPPALRSRFSICAEPPREETELDSGPFGPLQLNEEPLFLPNASQESNIDQHLDTEELEADIDLGDDTMGEQDAGQSDAMVFEYDEMSIESTQTRQLDESKTFRPLFDD